MSYFFMRFIAANDKLVFMFQLYTMIDFFTIPPSFVSLILGRVWIGLRCLRIMRLNSFPEILQYLNILETARSIRLLCLISSYPKWYICQTPAACGHVHVYLVDGCRVHSSHWELWRSSALQQPAEPLLLWVCLLHDCDHVHCGLRGYLPGYSYWKVRVIFLAA